MLPNAQFLSEVSRAIEIARALRARGLPVAFGTRGGSHAHLIDAAGFTATRLDPPVTPESEAAFLEAVLAMGPRTRHDFFTDDELRAAVDSEVALIRHLDADLVVTGFTLSAYLSTRIAGVPLASEHGGSFVPPVLARGLCPAAVNPPDPNLARLPLRVQQLVANRAPAFIRGPVAQLNRHARDRGVDPLPNMLSLMCADLTLVTELPEVLGLTTRDLEEWRPRWPLRVRRGTSFRWSGPLYARLDLPVPAAVEAFLADGPTVLVALTSVTETLLRAVVESARTSGRRLLVATPHDLADLADEHTLVTGTLPNHLVMPRVAAAVVMGGQGSVQTALASGTPFVGLPYHGEQELNVAVAERLGSAIRMAPAAAATTALPAAITRLLEEPAFAAAARAAAARYAGVDGGSLAAEVIIRWLGERSPGRTIRPSVERR
ncbi:nucleotide disphospho-sugar-binding domain-containing protein [Phycicoccus sp. HDW14]|uniref:glycosyltransferase n=1 Tax=Phycicoccus sp. HDW14 TaxID=2714941 RepID=UPI001F109CEF|nr:nucleotide disphospho-sugar-binding domain-containing protein [Phycicoccus sp. HDW14]